MNKDLVSLLDVSSLIISGKGKSGKGLFLFYYIKFLLKEKAIIFSAQEEYLFDRRVASATDQFDSLVDIKKYLSPYFLRPDFFNMIYLYKHDLLVKEIEHVLKTSTEKIVVFHQVEELFLFQHRNSIRMFYKSVVKIVSSMGKKVIFLSNSAHGNYQHVLDVAIEFTDVSLFIESKENRERLLTITELQENKEHPVVSFKANTNRVSLGFVEDDKSDDSYSREKVKNVLMVELGSSQGYIGRICSYIFNRKEFLVKYASSVSGILMEMFISPDVVIVFLKREEESFLAISAIKKNSPNTKIIAVVDQDFVREEDRLEALSHGCDELLANNVSFGGLILAIEKSLNKYFYLDSVKAIPSYNNKISSADDLILLSKECMDRSVFFIIMNMKYSKRKGVKSSTNRKGDFIFQSKNEIYFLAINTLVMDSDKIMDGLKKEYMDLKLVSTWDPLNKGSKDFVSVEEFMSK